MATGYNIELGYNSGYTYQGRDEWEQLQRVVKQCRNDYSLILANIVCKTKSTYDGFSLDEFAKVYHEDTVMSPLIPMRESDGFLIMCSAGGESREAKEIVARAFCRLIFDEMSKLGISVNITSA